MEVSVTHARHLRAMPKEIGPAVFEVAHMIAEGLVEMSAEGMLHRTKRGDRELRFYDERRARKGEPHAE